jgi:phosphopantetheine--protein transferase-like protein
MSSDALQYFSGLLGKDVTADEPIRLTSVQAGAAHGWLTRRGIAPACNFSAGEQVSIARILGNAPTDSEPLSAKPALASAQRPAEASAGLRVGIDIEHSKNLPPATDYRTHPFYASHFSAAEISWCVGRRDCAESFAGLWAAKEAIRKAFGSELADLALGQIEIGRRDDGAPIYSGSSLSISHADGICVAVCVAGAPATSLSEPSGSATVLPPAKADARAHVGSRLLIATLLVSMMALVISIYALALK